MREKYLLQYSEVAAALMVTSRCEEAAKIRVSPAFCWFFVASEFAHALKGSTSAT